MAKIIVVDDDKVVRTIVEKTLTRAGHTVQVAVDGAKAVSMIENEKYDMAILDILLPGLLNGFKLISKTKSVSSKIVIFAITGHGKQSHQRKAMSLGADEFMVKPVKPQYLLDKVNEYLGIEKKPEEPRQPAFTPPAFESQPPPESKPEPEPKQPEPIEEPEPESSGSPFDFDFDFESETKKEPEQQAPAEPPPPIFEKKPEPVPEPKPKPEKQESPEPRRPFLIFRAMSKQTQDEIINLGRTRELFKGSIVDVDISSNFFILKQGVVTCLAHETPIFKMQVGDIMGETILFPFKNVSLYLKLRADQDSKILLISRKQLMKYLVTNRKVMVQFMGNCLTTLSEKYANCIDIIEKI
ncbi:MAG: response regulator [candidate division KSB1 bacterium]|nr:response regulator [candidate division KSB1 bacterium]